MIRFEEILDRVAKHHPGDNLDLVRHSFKNAQVVLTSNLASTTNARIAREVPAAGFDIGAASSRSN